MRVLVAGATGYVGSRLVPALLDRGHDVVAVSSSRADPARFPWGGRVEWRRVDLTDEVATHAGLEGVDTLCYLVHSLDRGSFSARDRRAAENVRAAVSAHGVRRLVYLSGLVPDVPRRELSRHIASRLEVEEILARGDTATLSLRAGVVLGAGSTSFEIMRQLASLLLVQPLPRWMGSRVQPIAVTDVVELLATALEAGEPTGHLDIGGPDVLTYPDLLGLYCDVARLVRVQVPAPLAPVAAVGGLAGLLSGAPYRTVTALVESLRHDMVARPPGAAALGDRALMPVAEAIRRALHPHPAPAHDPQGPLPGDAPWTADGTWVERASGIRLPQPTVVRAATRLAEHRAAYVLGKLLSPPAPPRTPATPAPTSPSG